MSNRAENPSHRPVRICHAGDDWSKKISIFITMAPNLTEPYPWRVVRILRQAEYLERTDPA
jgi:hypothetical protein